MRDVQVVCANVALVNTNRPIAAIASDFNEVWIFGVGHGDMEFVTGGDPDPCDHEVMQSAIVSLQIQLNTRD